jgi:hypothetical protein
VDYIPPLFGEPKDAHSVAISASCFSFPSSQSLTDGSLSSFELAKGMCTNGCASSDSQQKAASGLKNTEAVFAGYPIRQLALVSHSFGDIFEKVFERASPDSLEENMTKTPQTFDAPVIQGKLTVYNNVPVRPVRRLGVPFQFARGFQRTHEFSEFLDNVSSAASSSSMRDRRAAKSLLVDSEGKVYIVDCVWGSGIDLTRNLQTAHGVEP